MKKALKEGHQAFLKKQRSMAERRCLLRNTDKYIGRTADNLISPVAEKASLRGQV